MDSSRIKLIVIAVLAAFAALYLGIAAATAQVATVAWVLGGMFMVLVLALGKHVWGLIPAFLILTGGISALPGSPPPWALAAAVVAGMYAIRYATRRHDFAFRWDWMDFAILLQMVAIAQALIRNPSGLGVLGGSVAGGKPYFIYAGVLLAYASLAITRPTANAIRWVIIAMVLLGVLDGIAYVARDYFPGFAFASGKFYGGDLITAMSFEGIDLSEGRGGPGMAILGRNLLLPLFCLLPTIRCINPFRILPFILTIAGSVLILLSGFRSAVAYFVVLFVVAATARRRYLDIVFAGALGVVALILILSSGHLDKLPFGVQRVFSAIGADVRTEAILSAEGSSNDRFEVWRTVLASDRYITNKWLGDGFNLSNREQQLLNDQAMGKGGRDERLTSFVEWSLMTGDYHGFHVEIIRYTGAFGLCCALFAMIIFFRKGLVLVRHFRGQPIFGQVLYICLPVMIYLFWSLLVFGSYKVDFPPILIMAGMLKMLDNLRISQIAEAIVTTNNS